MLKSIQRLYVVYNVRVQEPLHALLVSRPYTISSCILLYCPQTTTLVGVSKLITHFIVVLITDYTGRFLGWRS